MNTAIIVAAGSSRRMGFDKLFAPLAGRPVIAHSIAAFESCGEIDDLIVTKAEQMEAFKELIEREKFVKVRRTLVGGEHRHLSVWNGLQAVDVRAQFVAIHDGARPLTTPALISQCLAMARETGAACCASQIPDTVKRADEHQFVSDSVERSGLWAMQTPQIFATTVIVQAYASIIAAHEVVTDEVSAVQRLGKQISLLRNDEWNFKITLPRDLDLAEHVLASRGRR